MLNFPRQARASLVLALARRMSTVSGRLLPVLEYPAPVLRVKSDAIVDVHAVAVQQLVADLHRTVKDQHGLGLAANQVGATQRVFVVRKPAARTEQSAMQLSPLERQQLRLHPPEWFACLNPRVIAKSASTALGCEGCLSVPDFPALVRRPTSIDVSYMLPDGTTVEERLEGLPAVVFQHELDHLDGVLVVDRAVTAVLRGSLDAAVYKAQRAFSKQLSMYYGSAGDW